MTDPPMYNVASAIICRSLAIVRSLPLPGCCIRASHDTRSSFLRKHTTFPLIYAATINFDKIWSFFTPGRRQFERIKCRLLILGPNKHTGSEADIIWKPELLRK